MGTARRLEIFVRRASFAAARHPRWVRLGWMIGFIALCAVLAPVAVHGADIESCRKLLASGEYEACIEAAAAAIRNRESAEAWPCLKAQSELSLGRAAEANETLKAALGRYTESVQLRLLAHHAARCRGDRERAEKRLAEIEELASKTPWRYTGCDDLLALGEAGLIAGADPKDVLDGFFLKARAQSPSRREPHLAVGQLALEKGELEHAAEVFAEAAQRFPDDADMQFGLARALAPSEPLRAAAALTKAVKLNPRHVPALLMQADQAIDAERYDDASALVERILKTNPRESDAWAFKSVLAHLRGNPRGEAAFRDAGGADQNPGIDHLIGLKLSQKYRFKEGAEAQRRALAVDPKFVPAKVQLAHDLLRLGQEEEGWKLAAEAHAEDGYHVANFNLLELKDRIAKFKTLENESFLVRMDAKEAAVYGPRVLRLLDRAKRTLCDKYGLDLKDRITVEIFPDESDFAVRTFGMPAGAGYLGVCFGKVITTSSPASQKEQPVNWEAVLWHEFCHVVTLELTQNRMPRWLSEGISVYEEMQENPAWGQRMNPRYREMILGGELTPISELSGAFLHAKDPLKTSFAYYESALVVEYLVNRHGPDGLKSVLHDLRIGLPINTALDRNTDGLARLEEEFEVFARRRAEQLGKWADWTRHTPESGLDRWAGRDALDRHVSFLVEHPNNIEALSLLADIHMEDGEYEKARPLLQKLIELAPGMIGDGSAYERLAVVHRRSNDFTSEQGILELYAEAHPAALGGYLRLLEIHRKKEDWEAVAKNARRALAVNPMLPQVQRAALEAAEHLGETEEAIEAANALLVLDPDDAARTHYRLARLLQTKNDPDAKTHVLKSLEEAPRFRAAQQLLLEFTRESSSMR